jgi:hypothetical protein
MVAGEMQCEIFTQHIEKEWNSVRCERVIFFPVVKFSQRLYLQQNFYLQNPLCSPKVIY